MKIIYSFNKCGFEAKYWYEEITKASNEDVLFIPFNHDKYINPNLYIRAQLLDNLYYDKHPGLLQMYADMEKLISDSKANILLVDNAFPYHPEFLKKLSIYKVLRTTDGPITAYDRDFAYLHAYDHILYHTPAYNEYLGMAEKLQYCGAKKINFWPLGVFDTFYDTKMTEANILTKKRDIDVVYIGSMAIDKMPLLAFIKKSLGKNMRLHGLTNIKRNVYFNLKFGFPGWVKELDFEDYVPLYHRAKIGVNTHLRGQFSVGNYRLFDLPANGVMQICDGGDYLNDFFKVGKEIETYNSKEELLDKIKYYLKNDDARNRIALAGFKRVLQDHTMGHRLNELSKILHLDNIK